MHGNQYIFQSLPRLLTLWLDLGAHCADCETKKKYVLLRLFLIHLFGISSPLSPRKSKTEADQINARVAKALEECMTKSSSVITKLIKRLPAYQWCIQRTIYKT